MRDSSTKIARWYDRAMRGESPQSIQIGASGYSHSDIKFVLRMYAQKWSLPVPDSCSNTIDAAREENPDG